MSATDITFRILRYKPGAIDPPRFEAFPLSIRPAMTVLEALEQIRLTQDATLMYRHSCHHASCGTCACMINGVPKLACTTRIAELNTDVIALAPLDNHPCLGDLVVDVSGFFSKSPAAWTHLRRSETASAERTPPGLKSGLVRFENCIECGCCVAVCPVVSGQSEFMGPAALAALSRELHNQPEQRASLLQTAAGPGGAAQCRRHLACSRVCPGKVYPARHIADLNRALKKQDD
jgi:succinate dehydrogenase / fumarate reductase iron-sulfur subunit